MKRRILILSALIGIAVMLLFILNKTNGSPNRQKNGFTRSITPNAVTLIARTKIGNSIKDISGVEGDSIFFSDRKAGIFYIANKSLSKFDTIQIKLPDSAHYEPVFYTNVYYPNAYIMAGNARTIIKANLISKQKEIKVLRSEPFSSAVVLNSNDIAFKIIDTTTYNSGFKKVSFISDQSTVDNGLLPKLGDAGFTYDGKLSYDKKTNKLIYVCFYNNEFICFDSTFNLVYKSRTIDTFSTARVIVKRKKMAINQAEPPVMVNSNNCTYNGKLYVKSKMKGDNEDINEFDKSIAIDVYNIPNGKYMSSFYIPYLDGQKIRKFSIIGPNEIAVLYDRDIATYTLNISSLLQ